MGRNVHDIVHHSWADGSPCPREASPILAALAEGSALDSPDEAVLWNKEGRAFATRWSLRPLVDESELRGAVLTFTDMAAIREKESELRRAIEQREEVVSIVSHDLRNPLGVVLAASDLLLELPLDEAERRRQAENIQRSGKRMQSLIEELAAALARVGSGMDHERHERLQDLALVTDLIVTGWRTVDRRLARVERALERQTDAERARSDWTVRRITVGPSRRDR